MDKAVRIPEDYLVCRLHSRVVCHNCKVYLTFIKDDNDEKYGPLRFGDALRVATGRIVPAEFIPPSGNHTPQFLFPLTRSIMAAPPVQRFTRRRNHTQMLIYTDGECLDNGGSNPRAGCSFIYGPSAPAAPDPGYVCIRLENKGPTGEEHPQTKNRAELRAVIGALEFRAWDGEGFDSIVIATDSEPLVQGITIWAPRWLRNGWRTSKGDVVVNQDLWQHLLKKIAWFDAYGVDIYFWRISRILNSEAVSHARQAANQSAEGEYRVIVGAIG